MQVKDNFCGKNGLKCKKNQKNGLHFQKIVVFYMCCQQIVYVRS